QGHRTCASARRPAPVIFRRVISIGRPLASIRSVLAVASPTRTSSTRSSILNPCASNDDLCTAIKGCLKQFKSSAEHSSARRWRRHWCAVYSLYSPSALPVAARHIQTRRLTMRRESKRARWRLYLFVVQSGHQDLRDAMPIYISRRRFRRPVRAQPHFRSPLIAEKSPARSLASRLDVLDVVY